MQDVFFIQVGSNAGTVPNDPLSPFILRDQWKGVLIEPVPKIFEQLKKNYAGCPNLHFENVAISDTRKIADFFVVDENSDCVKDICSSEPLWGQQLGSLDGDFVLKSYPLLSKKDIRKIQVPCVTFQDILDKYKFERVDVIQIDAEGHDDIILLSIDLEKIQPKIIIFEHVHMTLEKYFQCTAHLHSHGYAVIHTTLMDTVAAKS